jgi:hypothetical protein
LKKYLVIFGIVFSGCAPSTPSIKEVCGYYQNADTAQKDVLILYSAITQKHGYNMLYVHNPNYGQRENISTGDWGFDDGSTWIDFSPNYPNGYARIDLRNWKAVTRDSLPMGHSALLGFVHYDKGNHNIIVIDSFTNNPTLKFIKKKDEQ